MANTKPAATKQTTAKQPQNGLAAIAAQVATAVTANSAAGTVARRPAIAYTNGAVQTAAGQTVTLQGALTGYTGNLPATNPANSGKVGTVTVTGQLALGNSPKRQLVGHNLRMHTAICNALPCTPQHAATVCGSAPFVPYAIKNGWFTVNK
jgi:hypothetical protein